METTTFFPFSICDEKKMLKHQKNISTRERCIKHKFAGQNTQHPITVFYFGGRGLNSNQGASSIVDCKIRVTILKS